MGSLYIVDCILYIVVGLVWFFVVGSFVLGCMLYRFFRIGIWNLDIGNLYTLDAMFRVF